MHKGSSNCIVSFCYPLANRAGGNAHRVIKTETLPVAVEQRINAPIEVYIKSNGPDCYEMRCFKNGVEIQFCGSGILAATFALGNKTSNKSALTFTTPKQPVTIKKRHELLGFTTRAAKFTPGKHPQFWQRVIGHPLQKVTYTGTNQGYAIVELATSNQVKSAVINLKQLKKYSRRALIITAPINSGNAIAMRYFAPQYGNPEDAATGSANAILAAYWAKRMRRGLMKSDQLSKEGGLFYSYYHPPYVTIYGNVKTL